MLGSNRFHRRWQVLHGRRACPFYYREVPCDGLQNLLRETEKSSTCKVD